jgi:hypothetical protein
MGILCKSNSTNCEQFYGCITWSVRQMRHKSRIVASAITRFKSLWLLFVRHAKRKSVREQSALFGRTARKY